MPGRPSEAGGAIVPSGFCQDGPDPIVYKVHHGLPKPPARISVCWANGNRLRIAFFQRSHPQSAPPNADSALVPIAEGTGAKVVELRLASRGEEDNDEAEKRRISYASVPAFALLQSQKQIMMGSGGPTTGFSVDWWEHVMEFSRNISTILGLFRKKFPEEDPDYWDGLASALAVGWLDFVVRFLRMHGSYHLDQIDNREALEGMLSLAQRCIQLKPTSDNDRFTDLMVGIVGDDIEVVLAECSRIFDPWMLAHMIELLTAKNPQAELLLRDEKYELGGISLEELHRLIYAQVLSSHSFTWQGLRLLEILLLRQPLAGDNQLALKALEICRLYELDAVGISIMKIVGIHHWKHSRKGAGILWLQRAHDENRLSAIAEQLLGFVGKSVSDDTFQELQGWNTENLAMTTTPNAITLCGLIDLDMSSK